MNGSLISAIRGPVLLITLGGLLALERFMGQRRNEVSEADAR